MIQIRYFASLREQLREEGLMLEQELSSQPTRVNLLEALFPHLLSL